ncbi:UTP:GlnB (protein PII) uridylyltransferase [Bacteroidales bacterium Barb4]|nr:UTP:GlnB (protein PII) uridylyltransferase [Bacteroidales bacterium Barb4]
MPIPNNHKGKYFFHFTHLENLDSIIKHGLLSTNKKNQSGITHIDIATKGIQERRSTMDVSCGPKGKVHDYVPFYFTSINPMLLSVVNSKNKDQQFFIFLAVSIDHIDNADTVFTDASANTDPPPNFYDSPNDLDKLDWNIIDKRAWKYSYEERHKKMAEVLIHEKVPIEKIEYIIVWNDSIKKAVLTVFKQNNTKPPEISIATFKNKFYFYFTKFFLGRKNKSLITGPCFLKLHCFNIIKEIQEKREKEQSGNYLFSNIDDALQKINSNFCILKELNDIYKLQTSNEAHKDCVSDHTLKVVEELKSGTDYPNFEDKDKKILELSAYLHDIGKGPKTKWEGGIQKAYPDHPADAIPMLERILVEDFETISDYEIRKICLLVTYHDLVADIIEKKRDIQQIVDVADNEKELDMLIALNIADVSAINSTWKSKVETELPAFKSKVLKEISNKK